MQSLVEQFSQFGQGLEPQVVSFLKTTNSPIAVACSGGPDSIATALIVKELAHAPITLLHFDHRLRGRSSTKDAEFVRSFAKEIGADFRLGVWEKPEKKNETAARNARMQFLHSWEYETIVFGHHADDAVESLLMRLARGASLQGLCAPHAINKVKNHLHLRPLICLRKKEILHALKKNKISFRRDQTNFGTDYLRNRIRNKLLPLWQKIETRDVSAGILASQQHLKKFLPEFESLKEKTFIQAKEYELTHQSYSVTLPLGCTVFFPFGGSISSKLIPAPTPNEIRKLTDPRTRVFIAHKGFSLKVNSRSASRYRPLGGPTRSVKNLLMESYGQYPAYLRAVWPIVCEGVFPVWLPGARISAHASVGVKDSHVIELNFSPPEVNLGGDDLTEDN